MLEVECAVEPAETELRALARPGKRILRDTEVPLDSDFDGVNDISLVGELGTLFGNVGASMAAFRSFASSSGLVVISFCADCDFSECAGVGILAGLDRRGFEGGGGLMEVNGLSMDPVSSIFSRLLGAGFLLLRLRPADKDELWVAAVRDIGDFEEWASCSVSSSTWGRNHELTVVATTNFTHLALRRS